MTLAVTCYSDPGCPWAYSASPALAVLRWRYGSQLSWRLVTIGLTERGAQYEERGYTPVRAARGYRAFRRYGMPFATDPRMRMVATGRACRAVVATRLLDPPHELEVFRALQFAWFTTALLLDEDSGLATALERVDGLDVSAIVAALDGDAVSAAYADDRSEARSAGGGPTHFQGRAAQTDGPVRYTAPSLIFEVDGRRLEGGGFQPVEAYDVLVANLDTSLERRAPPEDPLDALTALPEGLVTQEVAAVMAHNNEQPDHAAAEDALIELAGHGRARRIPMGDGALWRVD